MLRENEFLRLKNNIYTVEISDEIIDFVKRSPDSVVLAIDDGKLVLRPFSAIDTEQVTKEFGNLVSSYQEEDRMVRQHGLLRAIDPLVNDELIASSIIKGKEIDRTDRPQSTPLGYKNVIRNTPIPGTSYEFKSSISANSQKDYAYYKNLGGYEIASTHALKRVDFDLNYESFVSRVIKLVETKDRNSFSGKIKTNAFLGANYESYSLDWWRKANWRKRFFLFVSPKYSKDLVESITSQKWDLIDEIKQNQVLMQRIQDYMSRLPYIGQSFLEN